jgi:predicted metalloprotease with PDZ domain
MKKQDETIKAVWLEWRCPRNKDEAGCFGETRYTNNNTARIFINTKRNKTNRDFVTTFWHEMFHTFCVFHKKKLSAKQEEDLAQRLEEIIWEVIR